MQEERGDWPEDGVRALPNLAQQMTERYADSLEADCRKDAAALFQVLWRSVPLARKLSTASISCLLHGGGGERVVRRGRGPSGLLKGGGLYLERGFRISKQLTRHLATWQRVAATCFCPAPGRKGQSASRAESAPRAETTL